MGNLDVNMSGTFLLSLLDSRLVYEGLATSFLEATWRERVEITAFSLNPTVFNMVFFDLSCMYVTQSIKILFYPLHKIKLKSTAGVGVRYLLGWLK